MSDVITTTSNNANFPVVDITHKPRRLQADNIIAAGKQSVSEDDKGMSEDPTSCVPLHGVTIERAIQYYEANACGEYATLYRTTAKWLRQLLTVGRTAVLKAEREAESEVVTHEKEAEIQKGE